MSRLAFVIAALTLPALSAVAAAQPSPDRGTVFIGATGFAAIEKAAETRGLGDSDNSGTVAGGALSVGVHLTPRVSARFEWALTDRLKTKQPIGVPGAMASGIAQSGPFVGMQGSMSLGLTNISSIVESNFRQERQTMTGLALLGYHLGDGRVSLEVLGGLGLVNQEVETSYDVRILRGERLRLPQPSYSTSTHHAVGVVGADVNVALTDHASIVPSVRAFALNSGLSVRPGVGLRWTF